jgi:hypothetical protein
MKVKGCVHVHVKEGRIVNVFSHLTELPEDGVIHLVPDEELTEEQFAESHAQDANELHLEPQMKVHDLGDESV